MRNPMDAYKSAFSLPLPSANADQNTGTNSNQLKNANVSITPTEAKARAAHDLGMKVNVNFPPHLYIPEGAEGIDGRRVENVPTGTVKHEIFRFTAPLGCITRFISYGIFNDGLKAADYEFLPLVNNSRVLPYHGDPMNNFKLDLSLSTNLDGAALIPCQIALLPNQTIQWLITNTSGVDTSMGVRMVGYYDNSITRMTTKFS